MSERFENWDPSQGRRVDGEPLRAVRLAARRHRLTTVELSEAMSVARAAGHSDAMIRSMLEA